MDAMLVLKGTIVLTLALLGERVLRRGPAATRHRFWSVAFAAILVLPLAASTLPSLRVAVPAALAAVASPSSHREMPPGRADQRSGSGTRPDPEAAPVGAASTAGGPVERGSSTPGPPPDSARMPIGARWIRSTPIVLLLVMWLTGTIAAIAALLLSLVGVLRLARRSEELLDPAWRIASAAIGARLGLRHSPRLVVNSHVLTPMAGGIWMPVVFLPAAAGTWNAERRDVVLAHELAHLAGRDPLRHVAMRLALALYWFHPLAWIAARHATAAREQACDEAVLALGTRPSAYARVLLDLADSMHGSVAPSGALAMVERSLLEARLMTILSSKIHPAEARKLSIPSIAVAVLTLAIAVAQPAAPGAAKSIAPDAPARAASSVAAPAWLGEATARVREWASQASITGDSACSWDSSGDSAFMGSTSTRVVRGRTVILEQMGTRGTTRVVQKRFGDTQLCMLAEDAGERQKTERPSEWPGRARRVVLEARRGGVVQRLEIEGGAAANQRISWQVGSVRRPFDADAQRWRDRMLAVLDTTWELSTLRGEVSTLHGEISSIHGHESSLRGEISSLRGEVSSMQGRASSIRGEESSLRGRISSIQGHVSSLRGAISSEQGAISSLSAVGYPLDDAGRERRATRLRDHLAEIARLEQAIRDYDADAKIAAVEREIAALDSSAKVAAIDAQIRASDLDAKVAAVERRIADLDVAGKVAAIERQIAALDAERRTRLLEERRDVELRQLDAAIDAIRR
jgi:beta-lactamase regulating signal transducer with metallopeptidase domain